MSLLQDALTHLGEVILTGFDGTELSDDTAAFLTQARIGGVLLFSKNYTNPTQVAQLINQVQECRNDLPLWVSVDHEGGRVQRFREHFSIIPPARRIGAVNSPKLSFDIAELIGRELRSVGINLNFNPVCDIETNLSNPVLGDRAYGTTEDDVSKQVTAIIRGQLTQGVQGCAKHFPGHGDTNKDSHFDLPKVDTPLEVLRERELKPFVKCFKSRCNFVMTAHVIYEKIDPQVPATFSSKILREILRKEIRYSKIIISDDLEMEAITKHWGAEEAPRLALQAGCDLLIYRTEKAARHAYMSLRKALESDQLDPKIVLEAAERSREIKNSELLPYSPVDPHAWKSVLSSPEHQELLQRIP
jgi:beta-N-acetylhexosaminidase